MTISHLSNRFLLDKWTSFVNTVTLSPFHQKNLIAATTEKFLSMSFHFPHNCKTLISRILILLKTFVQTFGELILLSHLHHIKPSWTLQLALPPPPPPPLFSEFMGKYTTATHLCTLIKTIHPVSISCIYLHSQANNYRLLNSVTGGCRPDVLEVIANIIHNHNPYACAYRG